MLTTQDLNLRTYNPKLGIRRHLTQVGTRFTASLLSQQIGDAGERVPTRLRVPKQTGSRPGRLTAFEASGTVPKMQSLPPSCPPLPDLPPLFWTRVAEQVAYWQEFFAQAAPGDARPAEMRKVCISRIKTRLKRINAGKNAGRSLFELADYVACLSVIDSRN